MEGVRVLHAIFFFFHKIHCHINNLSYINFNWARSITFLGWSGSVLPPSAAQAGSHLLSFSLFSLLGFFQSLWLCLSGVETEQKTPSPYLFGYHAQLQG